ncbi:hypothetical protein [Bacillus xiapuensis]|uniref:Uncharacterized protein n=1 Tax=Bacillus xiapuensis TaxID=2014075 RepID=A0ABU6N8M4_9BACI|nr:hypothetical protein [Bacillus xiapuensis]
MENNLVKLHFSYTDELNQESVYKRTIATDTVLLDGTLEILLENFKLFLKASGIDEELVDRIQLTEEEFEDDFDEIEEENTAVSDDE